MNVTYLYEIVTHHKTESQTKPVAIVYSKNKAIRHVNHITICYCSHNNIIFANNKELLAGQKSLSVQPDLCASNVFSGSNVFFGVYRTAGNRTVKTVPFPVADSNESEPLCSLMM